MNRPISYFVSAGALSSLAFTLVVAAAAPDNADRPNTPDRGAYRDKDASETHGQENKERDNSPQGFLRSALLGGMKEVRISQLAVERSENTEVKTFAQRMVQDHTKVNDQLRDLAQRKGWTLPATNYFDSALSPSSNSGSEHEKANATGDAAGRDRSKSDRVDTVAADREARDRGTWQVSGKDASDRKTGDARWDRTQMQGRNSIESLRSLPAADFDKAYAREILRGHMSSVQKYEQASQQSSDSEIQEFAKNTLPTLKDHHRQAKDLARSLGVTVEQGGKISSRDTEKRRRE